MRVLILGGGGAMGAVAARITAALPGVTSLVIADRHLPAAQRAVAACAHPGRGAVSAEHVDVTNDAALRTLTDRADVVLNTVGPFTRFGSTVLEAAIDTGTHYLDICDDPEPTTAMLAWADRARTAGITAIVGMGASPGMSNLLAALAVARLDDVDDLYTAWPVDVGDASGEPQTAHDAGRRPSAAAVHWMEQISGVVPVVVGGSLVAGPPLQPVPLHLPGGHAGTAYVVGHPEPLTLATSYAPTGNVACLMVITAPSVAFLDGLRSDIDAGRLDYERAAVELSAPSLRHVIRAGLRAWRFAGPGTLPPFFAAATGRRDGRQFTVLATLDNAGGGMAEATGVPLALGLAQVIDGTAQRPGVWPPEQAIEPARMMADLHRLTSIPGRNQVRISSSASSELDTRSRRRWRRLIMSK